MSSTASMVGATCTSASSPRTGRSLSTTIGTRRSIPAILRRTPDTLPTNALRHRNTVIKATARIPGTRRSGKAILAMALIHGSPPILAIADQRLAKSQSQFVPTRCAPKTWTAANLPTQATNNKCTQP